MRHIRWPQLLGALGALVVGLAVPILAAAAQTGGCSATIDGVDVRDGRSAKSPIRVDADASVVVSGVAPGPIDTYGVDLVFGPFSFDAASGSVEGGDTSYQTVVDVADYARYGVGLYRAEGWTTGTVCREWTYIEVTGRSPLTTPAGLAGAGLAAGGIAGMVAAAVGAGSAPKGGAA